MKPSSSKIENNHILEVNWVDRWRIYKRLQELDIPCWCEANQPLRVEISNPKAAIQLWSVVRQFTASRHEQIWILENIWQSRY
ncbi:Asr1405/Asl0597 family protein [Calothrix sp. PCC 7507]|uniref:Asr1405/Asl0597 family protein n=1 Tax=Calothrix sp. PCC 7507 TaxID=99598 RepID=UPI00029ED94D|nr:Asr1405/Asl0597 family protein [Calothrix sp. PCC 7507]AFY32407.1 hypothetical protein Cal7507_1960 [Calothrix sp. PCC 7507]